MVYPIGHLFFFLNKVEDTLSFRINEAVDSSMANWQLYEILKRSKNFKSQYLHMRGWGLDTLDILTKSNNGGELGP